MKIIFASGIAGVGKPEYLALFQAYCKKNKKRCQIISIGSLIFQIAHEGGLQIKEDKLLNLPRSTVKSLISNAFERATKIIDPTSDVVIFSTHASYWWKNGPEHAFDLSYLHKIMPDMYLTLTNNPLTIQKNIEADPKWGKDIISLKEIMVWSELENYTTEILALLQKKPNYLVHYQHPVSNLYQLLFAEKTKKVYISYPMTYATPAVIKKTQAFIKDLKKHVIVFEPILVDDLSEIKDKEAMATYQNQIVRRDYRFIDQSDGIVIYFPKIVASPGVENERAYAHQTNKEVWIIYPTERMSPFVSYYTDRFFKTPKEVIEAIKKSPH